MLFNLFKRSAHSSLTSAEIRSRFLAFFEKRGHAVIPSAPLVPENDPSVLFNTAGMQPLVPYLIGRTHPSGDKLVDVQKCVRTNDIEDVGDNRHLTFFEMLGNWSLGSYFKEDAIKWSYALLTDKNEGFGLDPERLYVTVFAGDHNSPKDTESANIWKSVGVPENRIYFKDASANWWPAVKGKDTWTGPTGPCTEMFYDITDKGLGDMSQEEYDRADESGKVIEIWNDVFMEYEKKDGKIIGKLAKRNVDTGAGFERICAVVQNKDNVFETDLFKPLLDDIKNASKKYDERSARIYADHMRTSVFLISDGVVPSNKDQGYILRRLLRRAILKARKLGLSDGYVINNTVSVLSDIYSITYPELADPIISEEIKAEEVRFRKTLEQGIREFEKGADAFELATTYGFPIELTMELAKEKGLEINLETFNAKMLAHQSLSRSGAEQKFKGGLADANDPMVLRYHTATHLLHQALHDVLGEGTGDQKGSNITAERLRFDFTGQKLTDEQKKKVEDIVNQKIAEKLPMSQIILPKAEAEKTGARHFFGEKYGDDVSIYFIGPVAAKDSSGAPLPTRADLVNAYSKEFCGGPHVSNTSELAGPKENWRFKIQKEEAVSQGVRRIKAILA